MTYKIIERRGAKFCSPSFFAICQKTDYLNIAQGNPKINQKGYYTEKRSRSN